MSDDFSFVTSGLPMAVRVAGFRGLESLSQCYTFDVYVTVAAELDVDPQDVIGLRGTLFNNLDGAPDRVHGVVTEIELIRSVKDDLLTATSLYRLRLAPQLAALAQTKHSRIFTDVTVLDVLRSVLEEEGLSSDDYEIRGSGTYQVESMITQYKESSLDFLHRWMEREGLYYYFEHGDDAEKLIITDDKGQHEPVPLLLAAVPYRPTTGKDWSAGAHFQEVLIKHAAAPGSVRLNDFDYRKPRLDLSSRSAIASNGLGVISTYGQRFFTAAEGARLARLRAEELRVAAMRHEFSGPVGRLHPGYTVDLSEHPKPSLNQRYLLVGVEHSGFSPRIGAWGDVVKHDSEDVYRVKALCLPADVQYRHPSKTPWPSIDGFENATVDGPATSEYAQIDEDGRYSIKFHFDEGTLKDGRASTLVRMMQPHGGSTEGFHFPLRKGTEVLCAFLGGDADRPVIIGVVPNALTPSNVIANNNTQNIIQTGSGSYVTIEDKKGEQYVNIFCPYVPGQNANLYLGNDRPVGGHALTKPHAPEVVEQGEYVHAFSNPNFDLRTTGKGQLWTQNALNIVSESFTQIDSHDDLVFHATANWFRHIEGTSTEHLVGAFTQTIDGAVSETWKSTYTLDITGAATETLHATLTQSVTDNVAQTYSARHTMNVTGPQSMTVTNATSHTHNDGLAVTVNASLSEHKATANYKLEVISQANMHATDQFNIRGDSTAKLSAKNTRVEGDETVTVNGTNLVTIGPKNVTVNGSEIIKLNGPAVIQILGGDVTISGGNITVNGRSNIREEATGSFLIAGNATAIYGGPVVAVQGGVIKLNC
jgi:type VI secretion system secreted protein VgrG